MLPFPSQGQSRQNYTGFQCKVCPLSKSRPRTHLVAVLLGSIQNAVDEFAGDLVQVLMASWLLAGDLAQSELVKAIWNHPKI